MLVDAEMRAAEQAKRAASRELVIAKRNGDAAGVRDKTAAIERADEVIRENAAKREQVDGWAAYMSLSGAADGRLKDMRRMWEDREKTVAFDNAWRGEFGNR